MIDDWCVSWGLLVSFASTFFPKQRTPPTGAGNSWKLLFATATVYSHGCPLAYLSFYDWIYSINCFASHPRHKKAQPPTDGEPPVWVCGKCCLFPGFNWWSLVTVSIFLECLFIELTSGKASRTFIIAQCVLAWNYFNPQYKEAPTIATTISPMGDTVTKKTQYPMMDAPARGREK